MLRTYAIAAAITAVAAATGVVIGSAWAFMRRYDTGLGEYAEVLR